MNKKQNNKSGRFSSVVRAPVAQQVVLAYKKPAISTLSGGDIRIKHREFICDLKATSPAYGVLTSVPIQPGIGTSFPWLSRLAANFESYKFDNLTYHITTMASTSTTGTLGMALDYDASDAAPTSKVQSLAMQDSVRGPVWQPDFVLKANTSSLNKLKERFVRTVQIASTDIKMYDSGNLFVYADGVTIDSVIAELHVEYTVTLKTPQLGDLAPVTNDASLLFNVISASEEMGSRSIEDQESFFDMTVLPEYDGVVTPNIRHYGSLIDWDLPVRINPSLNREYNDLRFDRPGRYVMELNASSLADSDALMNWGFEFPQLDFANVRGILRHGPNAHGLPTSGFQAVASVMFEVLRAGAVMSLFFHVQTFKDAVRRFSVSPVPMSWAPLLTHQTAGVYEGDSGKVHRLWISGQKTLPRRSLTETAKQTPGNKDEPEPVKLKTEDDLRGRRIW